MMVSKEKPLNISRTKNYFSKLGLSSHLFAFNSLGNRVCHCITYNYLPKEDWAVFIVREEIDMTLKNSLMKMMHVDI
ncbi:hypothetical protein [Bartonella sp. HY406]|uniref:hypothetical protein n=1 Tax=Bartonella sp. HY406 TaxID=2979331 RepID=UPI0021C5F97F|nr:hypothetical protein [Bartonella sp. HY406]UXN02871.1 hypothetical protein N6B01_10395 [Bartonella sp. HY406]